MAIDINATIKHIQQCSNSDVTWKFFQKVRNLIRERPTDFAQIEPTDTGFVIKFTNGLALEMFEREGWIFANYTDKSGQHSCEVREWQKTDARRVYNGVIDKLTAPAAK